MENFLIRTFYLGVFMSLGAVVEGLEIFRAVIEGPGLHAIKDYPGIAEFHNKDLDYYDMVDYTAFRPPTSKADLTFMNKKNKVVMSFHIADFTRKEIASLIELYGFVRLTEKKKTASQLLNEAIAKGEPVKFKGKVINPKPRTPSKEL